MRPLPSHIRFLLLHAATGFGLALLFVLGLLWSDPRGIGMLLRQSPEWPWPAVWLWYFLGLTFGSVMMGGAIMLLGTSDPGNTTDEPRLNRPPVKRLPDSGQPSGE